MRFFARRQRSKSVCQENSYTVMLFHHHTSQPRQFSIRKKTVRAFVLVMVCLLGGQWIFFSHFFEQRQKLYELDHLRVELEVSQKEASAANTAIEKLRFQLADMKTLTTKVREMLGLQQDFDGAVSGQGGEELLPAFPGRTFSAVMEDTGRGGIRPDMQQEIAWLGSDAKVDHRDLRALVETIENRRERWEATPAIWPVKGWVTSGFGLRISPFTARPTNHHGIDIRASIGTPILAPADGTVVRRKHDTGFGKMITIAHGDGISTRYGHLHTMGVKVGQKLSRGDVIGTVGNTGLSTGPHLHYEVVVNKVRIDPRKYIIE
ncbi:MAG TPA: M23 family metallopeptidase [Nitrospirales bacterium]|nr:M23 family metallopeptidase [Nitrospirales bacterium]